MISRTNSGGSRLSPALAAMQNRIRIQLRAYGLKYRTMRGTIERSGAVGRDPCP